MRRVLFWHKDDSRGVTSVVDIRISCRARDPLSIMDLLRNIVLVENTKYLHEVITMKTKMGKICLLVLFAAVCLNLGSGVRQHPAQTEVREISIAELDVMAEEMGVTEAAEGTKIADTESTTILNTKYVTDSSQNGQKTLQHKKTNKADPSEWGLHITEEEIKLPDVKGEYEILFLTDTHVMIEDDGDSEAVREYRRIRYEQFFGKEDGVASDYLESLISYANAQEVDAVFLGGDIIDCPSQGNLNYLGTQLERLEMPYLYTLGNHDWTFPWEYMTERGRDTYLPKLESYLDGDTSLHIWETDDLLVIAVDDSSNQIDDGVMEQYRELLETDKPVILLMHVPLLTQSALGKAKEVWSTSVVLGGGNYGGIYPNETSTEFIELTTAKDSPVELVLSGHLHFYDKDNIVGEREILQIVGDAGFRGNGLLLHITGE